MAQANFTGARSIEGAPAGAKKFCPRCARPGVKVASETHEIWNCPFGHGEIHRSDLPQVEAEAEPEEESGTE